MNHQQHQDSRPASTELVQPLHPGNTALVTKTNIAKGHSEMGGKALLAKKMAASGQSFYSPTDTMVSPCTAKLHLAKKKHHAKGKPVALSSSFATAINNPMEPHSQQLPLTKAGFLHPSHARRAQFALAHQGDSAEEENEAPQQQQQQDEKAEEDVEMEM